jgi:hypothetical protein
MNRPPIPEESRARISALASSINANLEAEINIASQNAFNLGCFVGILPAAAFILLTYFLTGRSWIGAVISALMMSIGLLIFANLTAAVTRRNTLRRLYHTKARPEIERTLLEMGLTPADFDQIAAEALPSNAVLLEFIPALPPNGVEE